ncbi:TraY domain-containing protein [candidate division KSB1 bacterium]|nr:TraY domain-containing protein [candidate division KSB1 bacterium]NIV70647.1 TraY domain-containing protein [Phycisphaerae bacterium]NIS28178.1 TraY domain-containing protein [candidate division KSB1 bacterium]NIT75071.1 TraY domain-containing protein [candidate division KSB1 bacterium]NIU28857.1 TraY domain-containing protein [candidate division KSB1 bacterium]
MKQLAIYLDKETSALLEKRAKQNFRSMSKEAQFLIAKGLEADREVTAK